jgi:hypothetical protein
MYKNVVPTLQKAHFIHIIEDDILVLFTVFSDNLSNVLSTYHNYSESPKNKILKVFNKKQWLERYISIIKN